jgi:hypothetical protein
MPHEFFAGISGNTHVHKTKESPFEHNPNGYGHLDSPLKAEHKGIGAAVEKERQLVGLRKR